jgi:uncharacterized protein
MPASLDEKLRRLHGLRPAARHSSTQVLEPQPSAHSHSDLPLASERLERLLGAETARNHYGEHLAWRSWYAEPQHHEFLPEALHLLAPGLHADAANPENWLFLDTETTGLAGGTGTYAFLVGLAWWDAGGLQVEQLFLRDLDEEHSVLLALQERIAERPVLVTFNGKTFDWPLLETRFRMTRSIPPQTLRAHIDLLHPARQLWRLRLGSVRLCELEHHILGQERAEDVISALIPRFYFDFLRGGPAEPLVPVFQHNRMDLQGLAALTMHALALLSSPPSEDADPLDLFALSRLFERRGDTTRARQLYHQALDRGLPTAVDRAARLHLARLAKREGDLLLAHSLWEELCSDSREGLAAYEQLAIYYEHTARQPERAAEITRAALEELHEVNRRGALPDAAYRRCLAGLEHRLRRLSGKTQREKSSALFSTSSSKS